MHPVLFEIGDIAIHAYGALYLLAFLAAIFTAARLGTRSGIPFSRMVDIVFIMAISGEIGARIVFVVVEFDMFMDGSIDIWQFLTAGRVLMGGILCVPVAVWLLWKFKIPVLDFLDAAFTGAALGVAIGRIGCLMAGCCFGRPTSSWWGITFTDPRAFAFSGTPLGTPLHPTQILQSLNYFLLFGLLLYVHPRRVFPGMSFGIFFVYAGFTRFLIEMLRGDPRGALAGLSTSQWISLLMVLSGTALLIFARRRNLREPLFSREREWQFEVDDPEAVYLHLLEGRYDPECEIRYEGTAEIDDTYVDTADRAIHGAGFSLRFRRMEDQAEATIKSLQAGDRELRDRLEITERISTEGLTLPPGPVGLSLRGAVKDKELIPYLKMHTSRRRFLVLSGEKILAEIALDYTTVAGAIIKRLEIELRQGSEEEVLPLVEQLRQRCGLQPASCSKLEAGLEATAALPSP